MLKLNTYRCRYTPRTSRLSAVLLAMTVAFCNGCSRQDTVQPSPAEANEILKNNEGTIGPMKGTPGNP